MKNHHERNTNFKLGFFLILSFLFLLYFIPRFINIDKRFPFDWDQEKLSYEVKNIIVDHKLTLLGPRANNDRGFFLGPQLTYLLIPFYLLSKLHPSALIYFMIVYNITFFCAAFFIVRKMFSQKIAFVFLAIWSINTALAEADISPFWPIVIPLGVISIWFGLYNMYHNHDQPMWWFLHGLVLGFFLNMHFQFIFILLFTCFFVFFSRTTVKPTMQKLLYLFTGGILMFLPLIFFDLRHQFYNTSLFIRFFTEKDPNVGHWIGAWIPVFSNVALPFTLIRTEILSGSLFYLTVLIISILQVKYKTGFYKYFYFSSIALWLIFPVFFSIYGKRPSEYYFLFLYPLIILTFIDFFLSRKLSTVFIAFLILYFTYNSISLYPKLNTFGLNFYEKDKATKRIKQVLKGEMCDIAFNVPMGREVGYKYLFDFYQIKTIGNWKSCVININIPSRKGDEKFGYIGLHFPEELKPSSSKN